MNEALLKVLLVEDSPSDAALLEEALHGPGLAGIEIRHVECLGDGLRRLQQERFDVVLLDLSLPDSTGHDTILRTHAAAPRLPIVVLTGTPDDPFGMDCVRYGVQDYLVKGEADARQVGRAIRYAIERKQLDLEMRELQAALEQRVAERTAELHRLNLALRDEIARVRELEGKILKVSERNNAASAGIYMMVWAKLTTAAAMMSEGLAHDLRARRLPREAAVARRITKLCCSVTEQARHLAHGLNPVAQDGDGLMIALQGLAQFTSKLLRVRCRFICASPVVVPDVTAANHLFRIAQEAAHNAVRHARPKLIRITLSQHEAGVSLSIADDGCGLPPEAAAGRGMGLKMMRHRADLVGAAIRFEPGQPRGTTVTCSLPNHRPKQNSPATTAIVRARPRAAQTPLESTSSPLG